MMTERKIYTTTDGTQFDEADYPTPEAAKADAERYETKYHLIEKELFFRDGDLKVCEYEDAKFVSVTTEKAISTLEELCDEWGYYTPWGNCSDAFEAKTGFFIWSDSGNCWVDMDAEIERLNAAKAALIGEGKE